MKTSAPDVERYFAALPTDARVTLSSLRAAIRSAAPDATARISYGMPTFKHHGNLVAVAAFRGHCSLFPMSYAVLDAFQGDLARYDTAGAKATIRFPLGKAPPTALVKKIVRARMKENEARAKG